MSGIPPHLDTPVSAEPAGEWAAKTTSALNPGTPPTSVNPTTAQLFEEKNLRPGTVQPTVEGAGFTSGTALDTPGREVPGAYPNEQELQSRGQEITQTVSETASKAAEAAGGFAQTVQEAAATYLPKAAETVGQYLPKSVVDTVSTYVRK